MRFRRSGSRYEVRQFSNQVLLGPIAGATTSNDTLIFDAAAYLGSGAAAKAGKSYTVAFKSWYSDGLVTSVAVGTNAIFLNEYIYKADVNSASSNLYVATNFTSFNTTLGSDPRNLPPRIIFRRMVALYPIFGTVVSDHQNWIPLHPRTKVRVSDAEGLFWHLDLDNSAGTNTQNLNMRALSAIAIKLNP